MTRHEQLDNVTHRDLRINAVYAPGQGFDVNVARVFPLEFSRLQREYPLFFVRNNDTGHFETIVLLGFENGENLFLGDAGWDARCLPLTIERQPFLIGFQEREADGVPVSVPVVHVDMDHPAVNDGEGTPVFLPEGGESPYLERVNSVLQAIHDGHAQGETLSRSLVGLDLVESMTMAVEFDDGSTANLEGLYTIDADRLRSLDGPALERLHRQGQLDAVFLMLASLESMGALVERKNRRLQR